MQRYENGTAAVDAQHEAMDARGELQGKPVFADAHRAFVERLMVASDLLKQGAVRGLLVQVQRIKQGVIDLQNTLYRRVTGVVQGELQPPDRLVLAFVDKTGVHLAPGQMLVAL